MTYLMPALRKDVYWRLQLRYRLSHRLSALNVLRKLHDRLGFILRRDMGPGIYQEIER